MMKMSKATSMPAGIAIGVGICIVITVIGALILTGLISAEKVSEEEIGYGCMIILPIASAAGAICAGAAVKRRRLMVSGICSAAYFLVLLLTALMFGGQFEGMGVTALMILAGGGISLIPTFAGSRGGVRRHKNKGYR